MHRLEHQHHPASRHNVCSEHRFVDALVVRVSTWSNRYYRWSLTTHALSHSKSGKSYIKSLSYLESFGSTMSIVVALAFLARHDNCQLRQLLWLHRPTDLTNSIDDVFWLQTIPVMMTKDGKSKFPFLPIRKTIELWISHLTMVQSPPHTMRVSCQLPAMVINFCFIGSFIQTYPIITERKKIYRYCCGWMVGLDVRVWMDSSLNMDRSSW